MADETATATADEPQIDNDIAEHVRVEDPNGLVPRSAMNFVLMELQKLRGLVKTYKAK